MTEDLEKYGEHAKDIVEATEIMPAETHPKTLMEMASFALQRGDSLDVIERLMDLNDRHEAKEAKKAFIEAKAAFKADAPVVIKDLTNTQYNSKYTSKGNLINTVSPILGKYGLDAHFGVSQEEDQIKITCTLTHVAGHSESVSMVAPPDKSGSKNAIQQIKSTKTYLEIATFEAITGIASSEGSLDDDGNAADKEDPKFTTKEQKKEIGSLFKELKLSDKEIKKRLADRFEGIADLDEVFSDAADILIRALKKMVEVKANADN